jgi:serine/threonine-protein kinase
MDWGVAKVLPRGGVVDDATAGKVHDETVIATARSGSDAEDADLSRAGSVLGTPSYMAPEQARGEVEQVDQRADVFALGSILCEVLTGVPAFTGRSSAAILRKAALGDTGEAMRGFDSCGADPELIGLVKDCLAREREDRPHDASAVAGRMTAYLTGVQTRLHAAELAHAAEAARSEEARATAAQERRAREEAQGRAVAERRTRRLTATLAATVLLALMVGGGGWLWLKTERDARQARVARDVNAALYQAAALRAQASSTATGGAALFAQAREQAQRALALVENGPADAPLAAVVRSMQSDLDQEEKDRTLIAALDEARLKQAESIAGQNRFAQERAVPLFREALRAYGLPAGEADPKAAAARIRGRPAAVQEAIVAALDEWDEVAGDPSLHVTEPHRPWLQAVLAAGPDAPRGQPVLTYPAKPNRIFKRARLKSWSQQVRAARAEPSAARRRVALEKLAASADVTRVSARSLTRLAWRLDPAPGVALLRRAQWQYPADFWINEYLGLMLGRVTPPERDEAVRFLTAAAALSPDSPGCLLNLGVALRDKGQLDEAIACDRKAIELDPKYAAAHTALGSALFDKGQFDEAIASYHKAIELDPKYAAARTHLAKAQRLAAVRDKLPAFQNGSYTPASNEERVGLAEWCRIQKLHGTSTRLYAEAFATDPRLADDLEAAHRYNAGCSAALAAAGKGEDAATLDDVERARLRKQAVDWLRANLALRTKELESGTPAARAAVLKALRPWQQDPDLAGIRDPAALAQLPEAQRNECEALWAEVQAVLDHAGKDAP